MCKIWEKPLNNELTTEQIKKFFKQSNRFSWVDISGGEIFLRGDLTDVCQIILRSCRDLYFLHFPTNGLLTQTIVSKTKEFLSLRPKKLVVTVSLDGSADIHDKIRGVSGAWEKSIETYKRLRVLCSSNFDVFLGMTLVKDNIDKFQQGYIAVKKEIPGIRYKDFHINIPHNSNHYYGINIDTASATELRGAIDNILKSKRAFFTPFSFIESRYLRLAKKYLVTNRSPLNCQALSGSCFIDPQGDIYPCSIYSRKLGNLADFNFDLGQAWQSPVFIKTREDISKGMCNQCWTPCEAYLAILGNLLPWKRRKWIMQEIS